MTERDEALPGLLAGLSAREKWVWGNGVRYGRALAEVERPAQDAPAIEYGVTCGFARFCDRPRGHDGEHGAWVETTTDRIRASHRGDAQDVMDRLRNAQLYNALRMESDTRTWSATDWFLAGTQVGRADERRARAALGEEAK